MAGRKEFLMGRPNIIFYFSDQQRFDTCGVYGQPLPITPNLDALAADGVVQPAAGVRPLPGIVSDGTVSHGNRMFPEQYRAS